jgi:hypothetical protein
MERPNQRKDRLWREFHEKSGLAKTSRGFKLAIGVIAAILGAIVVSGLIR